jgi:hypothetical protein
METTAFSVNPAESGPHGELSSPNGRAAFHGGVLRITQKRLYARTAIAIAPLHHLPISAPP